MTIHIKVEITDGDDGPNAKVIVDYAAGRAFLHWAYRRSITTTATYDEYATARTGPGGETVGGVVNIRRDVGTKEAALTREIASRIGRDLPTIIAVDLAGLKT